MNLIFQLQLFKGIRLRCHGVGDFTTPKSNSRRLPRYSRDSASSIHPILSGCRGFFGLQNLEYLVLFFFTGIIHNSDLVSKGNSSRALLCGHSPAYFFYGHSACPAERFLFMNYTIMNLKRNFHQSRYSFLVSSIVDSENTHSFSSLI